MEIWINCCWTIFRFVISSTARKVLRIDSLQGLCRITTDLGVSTRNSEPDVPCRHTLPVLLKQVCSRTILDWCSHGPYDHTVHRSRYSRNIPWTTLIQVVRALYPQTDRAEMSSHAIEISTSTIDTISSPAPRFTSIDEANNKDSWPIRFLHYLGRKCKSGHHRCIDWNHCYTIVGQASNDSYLNDVYLNDVYLNTWNPLY